MTSFIRMSHAVRRSGKRGRRHNAPGAIILYQRFDGAKTYQNHPFNDAPDAEPLLKIVRLRQGRVKAQLGARIRSLPVEDAGNQLIA